MEKIIVRRTDVFWGYLGITLNLGINMLLLPFILYFLNENEIGLWYIFLSINGMITLLDFGFAPVISRNMAYCWGGAEKLSSVGVYIIGNSHNSNYVLMHRVISICKVIYFIISLITVVLLLTIGTNYIEYVASAVPWKIRTRAWYIFVIAITINMYYGYYNALLIGSGGISESNKAITCARLIQILAVIFSLFMGWGLLGAVLSYLLYSASYRLLLKHAFWNYKNLKKFLSDKQEKLKGDEVKAVFLAIWPNSWREGLISLANFLTMQATTFICSFYYSLAETGCYGISLQIVNAIASVAAALYQIYQPKLQELSIGTQQEKNKNIFALSIIVFVVSYILMSIGVYVIGIPIINIIKPSLPIDKGILLWLIIYTFLFKRHSIYASYISNSNRLPYVKAYIISGICSVFLAVVISGAFPELGIYGLLMAQIIVQLIYNNWKWPQFVKKELRISSKGLLLIGFFELQQKIKNTLRR